MFKHASSRWQIVDLKISDVLQIYRSSINDCLPRFILRDATIQYENLPIVYPTIKRKCFAGQFEVFYFVPFLTCQYARVTKRHTHVSETSCPFHPCQVLDNSVQSAEQSGI